MDIAHLLSPSPEPAHLPAEPTVSIQNAGRAEPRPQTHLVISHDRQLVALPKAPTCTPPKGASARFKAPSKARYLVLNPQQPLMRKRKRNLSAKQLQVKSENQQDESQLYNLTLDINDLKQQVRDYMVHKSIRETRSLVNRQRFNAGVLRTTRHFFEVFRTGFREWQPQEAAFLATTIDQNIIISSGVRGLDPFFEQWRRYKKMLQPRYVMISSADILVSDADSCVVECRGEFEGKLTLAAIEALFPHILQDTELLGKVVNCRLVCPTHTLIYFDASGRIVQYDAHADMFEGLNRILAANPLDVITLMSSARISSEGSMIPDVNDTDSNNRDTLAYELLDAGGGGVTPGPPANSTASSAPLDSPSSRSSCSSRNLVEYILS